MSYELLDECDNFSAVRKFLNNLAENNQEWAGIPMPIDGEELIFEKRYPYAKIFAKQEIEQPEKDIWHFRNKFWSTRYRSDIYVGEKDGKITWGIIPGYNNLSYQLRTLGCSVAWGIEQEHNALETLAELIGHLKFKQYLLTGSFLEKSKRSRIMYMFRKLKPTVAINTVNDNPKILCSLCMHPIAYYQDSWAGAMTPTDDIIAHLMLMRADEHMFWKRCSQHPAYRPEAGL